MRFSNIERALSLYGLAYSQILPVESGYRNYIYPVELASGELINLLIYKSEAGIKDTIKNTNRISSFLAESGLPVRHQLDNRTIVMRSGETKIYGCLYNYLPGKTIPWEAYTMSHIKLIGKTLSLLHKASKEIPAEDAAHANDVVDTNTKRMLAYFSNDGVNTAMANKLKLKLNSSLLSKACQRIQKDNSPKQILHMDFVRGNILFDDANDSDQLREKGICISGILDFEKASYGNTLHDIARTLAFLLVDCKYKRSDKIIKYFIKSGYIKRGQSEIQNIDKLDVYLQYYLSYDFYKFLLHNPYESLDQNQHYLRTRDILLRTKVLETI